MLQLIVLKPLFDTRAKLATRLLFAQKTAGRNIILVGEV